MLAPKSDTMDAVISGMSQASINSSTTNTKEASRLPVSLVELLNNDLIIRQMSPYLGITALIYLASVSKAFKNLVYLTPQVFQYVDLSNLRSCPKALPENHGRDSSRAPLEQVFDRLGARNILRDIKTLVLDGLDVPLSLLFNILCSNSYNIRIISLQNVPSLGYDQLRSVLSYLIRPSRSQGTSFSRLLLVVLSRTLACEIAFRYFLVCGYCEYACSNSPRRARC